MSWLGGGLPLASEVPKCLGWGWGAEPGFGNLPEDGTLKLLREEQGFGG